jgi:hypothetical protein
MGIYDLARPQHPASPFFQEDTNEVYNKIGGNTTNISVSLEI